MNDRNKQILKNLGVVVGSSAIAFFVYKVAVTYIEVKKRQKEDEELALQDAIEEAKAIVEEPRHVEPIYISADIEEVEDLNLTYYTEHDEDVVQPYPKKYDTWEDELDANHKEEQRLKHDPDSDKALTQYINMRLSDLGPTIECQIYERLFEHSFHPKTSKDNLIFDHIVNARAEFFGPVSQWNSQATFAEVLLHFATLLDFDLNEGVDYWADVLLQNTGFQLDEPPEVYEDRVQSIIRHQYGLTDQLFGIFALPADDRDWGHTNFMEQYWLHTTRVMDENEAREDIGDDFYLVEDDIDF